MTNLAIELPHPTPPSRQNQQRKIWWLAAAMLALGIGTAYWQTLQVGFLTDDYLMLAFAQIAPLDGSVFAVEPIHWLLFHRPFALLVWQVMYRCWGLNPIPYHLLSLLLHALSSFLVMRLVHLITPEHLWSAVGAGLIFALLPLHVETVTWLACWFDLLVLPFCLGALISLICAWKYRRTSMYLLSLGLYQLAVWSKESAFTLPAIILAVGFLLVPRPPLKYLLTSTIPYGSILAINLIQRYLAWGSWSDAYPGLQSIADRAGSPKRPTALHGGRWLQYRRSCGVERVGERAEMPLLHWYPDRAHRQFRTRGHRRDPDPGSALGSCDKGQ